MPAATAAAWATGRARSALKCCRQSSPASPAPLGPIRCTDLCSPRAGPRGIASLSHFVPSLLGRLPRCPAGQGEVGARWRLGKAAERTVRKRAVGSQRLLMRDLLGGAVARAGERASGDGECLRGWDEGGREGLICPPSCLNKRRPPARTAHAGRGRTLGRGTGRAARAHAYLGGAEGGARPGRRRRTREAGNRKKPPGCGRRHGPCFGSFEEPRRAPELRRRSGRGRNSRRLRSRSGSCPSSASSGLPSSGEF